MTEDEQVVTGLQCVLIVVLVLFCVLKAAKEHPDWFGAEVKVTEPAWHSFDVKGLRHEGALRAERPDSVNGRRGF